MKSIIRQFRLSAALDDGARDTRLKEGGGDEPFIRELASLEPRLKAPQPRPAVPPELHDAIMDKVRQAALVRPPAPELEAETFWSGVTAVWRRGALWMAPASAAVLVAGLLIAAHFMRQQPALPAAEKPARELAGLPTTVLSPLSIELENLDRDLKNTTEFLLASVP